MEKGDYCFICKEQITDSDEMEKFTEVGISINVHEGCIPVFRSLLQRTLSERREVKEDIDRPFSFVDFLQQKKPKTEPEILACLAYFLEKQARKSLELTVEDVKEHLESADVKMYDISTTFIRARSRNRFFDRIPGSKPIRHRLSRTGVEFVNKLPERD